MVDDEEDVADDAKVANTEEGREEENSEIGQFQLPEETPEDGIFIPLWFGKEREVYYYKSSDPEWQSYATFSQDQKNIDELKRKHLHELVMRSILSFSRACCWQGERRCLPP